MSLTVRILLVEDEENDAELQEITGYWLRLNVVP